MFFFFSIVKCCQVEGSLCVFLNLFQVIVEIKNVELFSSLAFHATRRIAETLEISGEHSGFIIHCVCKKHSGCQNV